MKKEIIINYIFTDNEIREALDKVSSGMALTDIEARAIIAGAKKWIDFKDECEKDSSYQWGYGYTYY